MPHTRRQFMQQGLAFSAGFAGLTTLLRTPHAVANALRHPLADGYGPLVTDPAGLIDLPAGFSYTAFSPVGTEMDDGLLLPGKHDGMAAFAGAAGRVILVRNHELEETWTNRGPFGRFNERLSRVPRAKIFDFGDGGRPGLGGTTTAIYNPATRRIEKQFMSLLGTTYNCAGGPTPWGSWLTCEETTVGKAEGLDRDHGWVFEVPHTATAPVDPIPLTAMGRFRHEAIAVHPAVGCVYLTEDLADGAFYRFIPRTRDKLVDGGRLQALVAIDHATLDTKNWKSKSTLPVGTRLGVRWVDVDNVLSPNDDLRLQAASKGGALFARCEGIWWGNNAAFFAATTGGDKQLGQVWKYTPSPHEATPDESKSPASLELLLEPNDSKIVNNADNITVAPWGDLIVCEDGSGHNGLIGVTPAGHPYRLAMVRTSESETAGATFSPDGSILFVNIQSPGVTLAITGPWRA